MSWTKKCALAVMATCAISLASATARAASVTWTINSSLSKVSLAIPDQVVQGNKIGLRNQTGSGSTWTVGNTAFMSGTIGSTYTEGGSLDFNPANTILGINSGNYRPNPAAFNPLVTSTINTLGTYGNSSLAPGVFGTKAVAVDAFGLAAAYLAFRSVSYDIDSLAPMPFTGPTTGGTFNTAGIQFGIANALIDVDGISILIVGQLIPDMANTPISNLIGTSTNPGGTITGAGLNRTITIPLNIPIAIDVDGLILTASLTGSITASAVVPEPSTLMMAGIGLVSLAVCARRRILGRLA